MVSLEEQLESRDANNLDFLRFAAATLVILHHCFPLLGRRSEPWAELTGYEGFGQVGISIFFFMSGLLITRSREMHPGGSVFLAKRCRRIFPGLLAATLFCALVIGPLVTALPLARYFAEPGTHRFFVNAILPAFTYHLPGVFTHNPNDAVNGSMWSLPVEMVCYVAVAFGGSVGWLTRRTFPLVFVAILCAILWPYAVLGWHGLDLTRCCLSNDRFCYVYFLLGAAAYLYRAHLPVNRWLALLAVALYLATLSTGIVGYAASFVSVPYLILYAAFVRVRWMKRWARWGDVSYGMYIYAFPIQQCLVYFSGGRLGVPELFAGTMLLTLGVAFASWHLVERPAIAWRWPREPRLSPEPALAQPTVPAAG